jgi:hypothetical protein
MVIPQFGMIIRLLRYRWFYKLELLVVYSITVFIVPCSHFHFLNASLVLCSLHFSISPSSSLAFNVVLHVGSRKIYGVSASHFWHILYLLSFVMVPGLGNLIQKVTFEDELWECNDPRFCQILGNFFSLLYCLRWLDFHRDLKLFESI